MRKLKKVLCVTSLAILTLVGVLGITTDTKAVEGTLNTTGGNPNTSWKCTLSSATHGGAIYRLSGYAEDKNKHSSDVVRMNLTLFCNGSENETSNVVELDALKISTFADAAKSISNGKGTVYLEVSDNYYGYGSVRIYN